MRVIKSATAPNPIENQYWADLNADTYGNIIKTWNGKKWVPVNDTLNDSQDDAIQELKTKKVDKVEGKDLSSNDFTTDLKTKLEGLSNYDDTEVRDLIIALTARVAALETTAA